MSHVASGTGTIIACGLVLTFHSLLVQAADTYLHIVTESANFVQIQPEESQQHFYSRGLAPWCLDRPREGSKGNVNYWGCGVAYDEKVETATMNNITL